MTTTTTAFIQPPQISSSRRTMRTTITLLGTLASMKTWIFRRAALKLDQECCTTTTVDWKQLKWTCVFVSQFDLKRIMNLMVRFFFRIYIYHCGCVIFFFVINPPLHVTDFLLPPFPHFLLPTCATPGTAETDVTQKVRQFMPKMFDFWSSVLSVNRIQEPLLFDRPCSLKNPPNCIDDDSEEAWLSTYSCLSLAELGWCDSNSDYSMETTNRCPAACDKCKEQPPSIGGCAKHGDWNLTCGSTVR